MTLGDIVKAYRLEHGYSMAAFAARCGLTRGYISLLEANRSPYTGRPTVPSIDTFIKIANAMGLTLDELTEMCDGNQLISLNSEKNTRDDYEAEFLAIYKDLTDEQKRILMTVASSMAKENDEKAR